MERRDCFSSPVFTAQVPDAEELHHAVADWFEAEARASDGIQRSITQGWHSPADLAEREEPVIQAAMGLFQYHFERALELMYADGPQPAPELSIELSAWATVLERGGYSMVHDHGDVHLSAVYWPRAGDTAGLSGWLELVDPRRSSLRLPELPLLEARMRVRPSTGAVVIFPGYLQHFVHPYAGDTPRVSLAANATVRAV